MNATASTAMETHFFDQKKKKKDKEVLIRVSRLRITRGGVSQACEDRRCRRLGGGARCGQEKKTRTETANSALAKINNLINEIYKTRAGEACGMCFFHLASSGTLVVVGAEEQGGGAEEGSLRWWSGYGRTGIDGRGR